MFCLLVCLSSVCLNVLFAGVFSHSLFYILIFWCYKRTFAWPYMKHTEANYEHRRYELDLKDKSWVDAIETLNIGLPAQPMNLYC